MEAVSIRQDIPLKEIRGKKVLGSGRFPYTLYSFYVTLATGLLGALAKMLGLPVFFMALAGAMLAPFALWQFSLLLYGGRNCRFITEDGYYIVRHGLATHIPWEAVDAVEVKVRMTGSRMRFVFKADMVAEGMSRPPELNRGEDVIPYSEKGLALITRHAKAVVARE